MIRSLFLALSLMAAPAIACEDCPSCDCDCGCDCDCPDCDCDDGSCDPDQDQHKVAYT